MAPRKFACAPHKILKAPIGANRDMDPNFVAAHRGLAFAYKDKGSEKECISTSNHAIGACRLMFSSFAALSNSSTIGKAKSTFTRWIGPIMRPAFVKNRDTAFRNCLLR